MHQRLDVRAVVRRVFQIYVEQAPVLMPAAAVVFVISGILSALLVAASPGLALPGLLISLVAGALFTGMVVQLVADVQDGRRDASAGDLLRAAMPFLGQLLLVSVVVVLCVLVGIVLVVIPGLVVLTIWEVAVPVVVLERLPGLAPLGRSRELVRGNGWQVFAVIVLLVVMPIVLAAALQLAADSAGTGAGIVVRVVVGVLTQPLAALASAVLYFQLRSGQPPAAGEQPHTDVPGPTKPL